MSISKQHSCIRLNHYICILATCLALTSCLSTVKGEKHKHFWYGSTPFEKRQTIEAYKRDTVPMIEKFLAYISQAGAGELIFRGGEQGGPCGENNDGYDYWSPNIFGKPIDVNEVIKAGDEFLVPAGFSKRTKRQYENGDVTLFWLNKKDGGYVRVSSKRRKRDTLPQPNLYRKATRCHFSHKHPRDHVSNRLADRKQRETVVNSMQVLCPMDRSDHAVRVLTSSAFSAWISRVISLSREPLRSKITVCSEMRPNHPSKKVFREALCFDGGFFNCTN